MNNIDGKSNSSKAVVGTNKATGRVFTKKRNKVIISIACLLILMIIAIATLLIFNKSKVKTEQADNASAEQRQMRDYKPKTTEIFRYEIK